MVYFSKELAYLCCKVDMQLTNFISTFPLTQLVPVFYSHCSQAQNNENYSNTLQKKCPYSEFFCPNAGKYGAEKLRTGALFT